MFGKTWYWYITQLIKSITGKFITYFLEFYRENYKTNSISTKLKKTFWEINNVDVFISLWNQNRKFILLFSTSSNCPCVNMRIHNTWHTQRDTLLHCIDLYVNFVCSVFIHILALCVEHWHFYPVFMYIVVGWCVPSYFRYTSSVCTWKTKIRC